MTFVIPIEPPNVIQRTGIIASAVNFDLSHYDTALYDQLEITFFSSLKSSVKKRQAEFLAGRLVAKKALMDMGIHNFDVNIGENRQPIWPENILGTITHTHNLAICALVRSEDYSCLGVDTENILNSKTAGEISKNILTEREAKLLSNALGISQVCICTLAFSAKESLFKALYRRVNEYFDFLDVEILSCTSDCLTFGIIEPLSQDIKSGMRFNCHFQIDETVVHTIVCDTV